MIHNYSPSKFLLKKDYFEDYCKDVVATNKRLLEHSTIDLAEHELKFALDYIQGQCGVSFSFEELKAIVNIYPYVKVGIRDTGSGSKITQANLRELISTYFLRMDWIQPSARVSVVEINNFISLIRDQAAKMGYHVNDLPFVKGTVSYD